MQFVSLQAVKTSDHRVVEVSQVIDSRKSFSYSELHPYPSKEKGSGQRLGSKRRGTLTTVLIMAKRELSTTLKNLKFMQRARQREELAKKEEEKEEKAEHKVILPSGNKKCLVITEGDPKPGALSGRMSFQNFNPSIDKLNEEAEFNLKHRVSTTSTADKNGMNIGRENEASRYGNDGFNKSREYEEPGEDLHRKKLKVEMDAEDPYLSPRNAVGADNRNQSSSNSGRKISQHEHGKLDWRLLRPPTGRTKR